MSAEARQIVAADGSRKWVVADDIAATTRSARGLSYAATLEHVAWHDGDAIVLVPVGGGELVRVAEAGVQCLGADDHNVYFARDEGDGTSEIGCIDVQLHTHVIARCPGAIDGLVASGEYLACALRDDVYALRMRDGIAAGAPSVVY